MRRPGPSVRCNSGAIAFSEPRVRNKPSGSLGKTLLPAALLELAHPVKTSWQQVEELDKRRERFGLALSFS